MEQNIADMLKDAFSEVDTHFGSLQFDESINASQTQPAMDAEFELKDTSNLWATSDLHEETFTNIIKPEQTEDPDPDSSTDSEENELSNPTGFAISPGQDIKDDKDQAARKATAETPRARLEHQACIEHTVEEECCNSSDEEPNDCMPHEIGVGDASNMAEENKENDLSQEGAIKLFQESVGNQGIQSEEHQELSSILEFDENQTSEDKSSGSEDIVEEEEEEEEEEEKEEKGLDNYNPGESTEQENQLHVKCTIEEEYSMHSDEDTNDNSMPYEFVCGEANILGEENNGNDLNQEGTVQLSLESVENQGLQSEQLHEKLLSPVVFGENKTQKVRSSGSEDEDEDEDEEEDDEEEEGLGNYNTEEPAEQISQSDSGANMDKSLNRIQTNTPAIGFNEEDDLKEFTEEDQEGVKESLAEYPSDLFQSGGEETNKSEGDQPSLLVGSSMGDDYSVNKNMKNLSSVRDDNLQEQDVNSKDFTVTDSDPEIKIEEDLQDSQTNDSSTDEGDASKPSNIQQDYDSDVSSDHSTSHEETISGNSSSSPPVRHEEEWKTEVQCDNLAENLGRGDHDINYIGTGPENRGGIFPDTDRDVSNSSPVISNQELHSTLELVQLEQLVQPFIKAEERTPSEFLNSVRDTNSFIPEGFLLSDEGNLPFDDYDWSLMVEEPNDLILDEAEDQDYTENIEELDFDEDMEGVEQNERDWEQEKTRIEAFFKFYDDQVDTEDKSERNHKVTFCLDHESSEYDDQVDTEDKPEAKEHCSDLWDIPVDPPALNVEVISSRVAYSEYRESSEYEEDSESSEQELDTVPDTPVCAVKPEYNSESDDEPQEKLFYTEKPKVQPKKQQNIDPAQNTCPGKSKCLTVLKSVLALGLMTVIGVASFCWATDNLDWMR